MAGVAKITKEQIWAAAEELVAAGKSPTLAQVRAVVGGGSYTTISEAMTEWKAAQEASEAPIREPLPSVLEEAAARMMMEVWSVSTGLANDRLKAEREALDAARAEHERVQQETAEMADQLAEEIEALRSANEALQETIAAATESETEAKEALQTERLKVTQLQARLDALEESMQELRSEKDRLVRLTEESAKELRLLDKTNFELSAEVEQLRVVVQDKEKWIQGLATEAEQLRPLAERLQQAEAENAKLVAKVEQLERHNEKQASVFQAAILDAVTAAANGTAAAKKGRRDEK